MLNALVGHCTVRVCACYPRYRYEPLFNRLRTKETLGYTVDCSTRCTNGLMGFCICVVSASATPLHIEYAASKGRRAPSHPSLPAACLCRCLICLCASPLPPCHALAAAASMPLPPSLPPPPLPPSVPPPLSHPLPPRPAYVCLLEQATCHALSPLIPPVDRPHAQGDLPFERRSRCGQQVEVSELIGGGAPRSPLRIR